MITAKELKVGDVLMGKHTGDLLVKGFTEEESINGKSTHIILEDINYNKGTVYFAPLQRIMHSCYDVVRGNEFYPYKEEN